jgi:hypothetical protein
MKGMCLIPSLHFYLFYHFKQEWGIYLTPNLCSSPLLPFLDGVKHAPHLYLWSFHFFPFPCKMRHMLHSCLLIIISFSTFTWGDACASPMGFILHLFFVSKWNEACTSSLAIKLCFSSISTIGKAYASYLKLYLCCDYVGNTIIYCNHERKSDNYKGLWKKNHQFFFKTIAYFQFVMTSMVCWRLQHGHEMEGQVLLFHLCNQNHILIWMCVFIYVVLMWIFIFVFYQYHPLFFVCKMFLYDISYLKIRLENGTSVKIIEIFCNICINFEWLLAQVIAFIAVIDFLNWMLKI